MITNIKSENHRNILDNPRYKDDASVTEARRLFDAFVPSAIDKVLKDGDYHAFVNAIRPYDEFLWTKSKESDGPEHPIAYKKWKIYPSWSELLWAIVYARVGKQVSSMDLELIRTSKVLEGADNRGNNFYKDVDGGLALAGVINDQNVLIPVVVMEHKGGHFCKTACTGVNAIGRRFHDTNKNIITVQITENNISVGKSQSDELINEIDIFIVDRGRNQFNIDMYAPRNAAEMLKHEKHLIQLLNGANRQHFTNIRYAHASDQTLREQLSHSNYLAKDKHFT